MHTILPAFQRDQAAPEFAQGLQHKIVGPRPDTPLGQNVGLVAGVETLFVVELWPREIVEVDQGGLQVDRRPAQSDDLMNRTVVHVVGCVAAQQAKLVVG